MFKRTLIAAAAASITFAMPATAQVTTGGGLVNVTVSNIDILRNSLNKNDVQILNNLLNNNQVSLPVNVQVPIGIAANVCGTTVALLSAAGSGGGCTATNASGALGQAVAKQILHQRSGK